MGGHTSSPVEAEVPWPESAAVVSSGVVVGEPDVGGESVVEASVATSDGELVHPTRKPSASQSPSVRIAPHDSRNGSQAGSASFATARAFPRSAPQGGQTAARAHIGPTIVTGTSSTLLA